MLMWLPAVGFGSEIHPPTAFTFGSATSTTVLNIQPSNFITTAETFASDTGQFTATNLLSGTIGAFSVTGGNGKIINTGTQGTLVAQNLSSFTMPQAFVAITVTQNGTGASGSDIAGVGMVKDHNNYVMAEVDRIANTVKINLCISGSCTASSTVAFTPPAPPYQIGLSLVGNSLVAYTNSGSGWVYRQHLVSQSTYDFRVSGMSGWAGGFEANSTATSTWKFSTLNIGYFGTISAQDLHLVKYLNGTPYQSGNLIYFTASCADGYGSDGGGQYFTLYQCVWSYDTNSTAMALTGVIMSSRNGGTFNDIAGAYLIDPLGTTNRYIASPWPNTEYAASAKGNMNTVSGTTSTDLLTGFHIVTMTYLNTPDCNSSTNECWDADVALSGSTWYLSYAARPTGSQVLSELATSTDFSTWTRVGSAYNPGPGLTYDQTFAILNNGSLYFSYSPAGAQARLYDTSFSFIGTLQPNYDPGGPTSERMNIFGIGNTEYVMTWNSVKATNMSGNAWTWGQWLVGTGARSSYQPSSISGTVKISGNVNVQ
jgi:hypothetical protein